MKEWSEIHDWRKAQRRALKAQRSAMLRADRQRATDAIVRLLAEHGPRLKRFSFYWPMYGEPDLRPFVRQLVSAGAEASLPVVVEPAAPLEFWRWDPEGPLDRTGVWNIPIPAERNPVQPDVLLIPTLGFDESGFRLGYGGGFYDRTLGAMKPVPVTVGIGYDLGRLATIYPQPHDVPLDYVVTEIEISEPRAAAGTRQSSAGEASD